MPSLGMMTINALACVDSVLIPVQAAYLPVKGLQQLIKTIGRVKKQLNPKLKIEGILLTMVDNRSNYARDISLMVYNTYSASIKVFGTEIPMSVRASEVSVEGGSIYSYDPKGKAAFAYMALCRLFRKAAMYELISILRMPLQVMNTRMIMQECLPAQQWSLLMVLTEPLLLM